MVVVFVQKNRHAKPAKELPESNGNDIQNEGKMRFSTTGSASLHPV